MQSDDPLNVWWGVSDASARILYQAPPADAAEFWLVRSRDGFKDVITTVERRLIESTLEAAGGVQKKAAELLKIKPTTLNEMIKRHDIDPRRRRSFGVDPLDTPASSRRPGTGAELSRE